MTEMHLLSVFILKNTVSVCGGTNDNFAVILYFNIVSMSKLLLSNGVLISLHLKVNNLVKITCNAAVNMYVRSFVGAGSIVPVLSQDKLRPPSLRAWPTIDVVGVDNGTS